MNDERYSRSAAMIHWVLAISIFFLFVSSWWMHALPLSSKVHTYRQIPFQLHKNVGMTIVILLLVFLYVRFKHRPTGGTTGVMPIWMRKAALLDHIALYVLTFAVCLSGYVASSYSGWPTTLWWTLQLPDWGHADKSLNIFWSDVHLWIGWVLLAFLSVHIAGALYHAFSNDGAVQRMLR